MMHSIFSGKVLGKYGTNNMCPIRKSTLNGSSNTPKVTRVEDTGRQIYLHPVFQAADIPMSGMA
jgi:hypothetical protein